MTLDAYLATRSDRCPGCGYHEKTQGCACEGNRLKFKGQARAAAAHPDELARVEAVIREFAARGKPFSANDIRPHHGCKGGVVGKAFTNMRNADVIKPAGDEASTSDATHGHRIYKWVGAAA